MSSSKKRVVLLDEIRGFAIFCMVFYHAFIVMCELYQINWAYDAFKLLEPVQPYFAGLFILISGICCNFSKNNFVRGIKLLIVAVSITFISSVILPSWGFDGTQIYFGILHLLSFSMIFYPFLENFFKRIPAFIGAFICLAITFFFRDFPAGKLTVWGDISYKLPDKIHKIEWLFPIGVQPFDFFSADYFPLFPWMFLFFFGSFVGITFKEGRIPKSAYKRHSKIFEKLGKYAIYIYIAHIPVIYVLFTFLHWLSLKF